MNKFPGRPLPVLPQFRVFLGAHSIFLPPTLPGHAVCACRQCVAQGLGVCYIPPSLSPFPCCWNCMACRTSWKFFSLTISAVMDRNPPMSWCPWIVTSNSVTLGWLAMTVPTTITRQSECDVSPEYTQTQDWRGRSLRVIASPPLSHSPTSGTRSLDFGDPQRYVHVQYLYMPLYLLSQSRSFFSLCGSPVTTEHHATSSPCRFSFEIPSTVKLRMFGQQGSSFWSFSIEGPSSGAKTRSISCASSATNTGGPPAKRTLLMERMSRFRVDNCLR